MSLAWETKVLADLAGALAVRGNAMSDILVFPCEAILQLPRRSGDVVTSNDRGGYGDGLDAGRYDFIDILQGYPRNCDGRKLNFCSDLAGERQTRREIAGFGLA